MPNKLSLYFLLIGILSAACSPKTVAPQLATEPTDPKEIKEEVFVSDLQKVFDYRAELSREMRSQELNIQERIKLDDLNNRKVWSELMKINPSTLSPKDRISYDMFRFVVKDDLERFRYKDYLLSFNAEGGFFTSLAFAQQRTNFDNPRGYESFLSTLKGHKSKMGQNVALLRTAIAEEITLPKVIAVKYAVLIEPYLNEDIESHIAYQPFLALEENDPIRVEARKVVKDSILHSYKAFDEFMKSDYLPNTRKGIGISNISNGLEYYDQRIKYFTTLDMTADQVFDVGMKEVKRIKSEMMDIIKEVGFEGSFADFLAFLRTDEQFYHTEPKALLKDAAYFSKKIDGLLPLYFKVLPELPYGVQPVPDAIAPNYTGGRYVPGDRESNRSGTYWVNTYNLKSRPLYVLPALTLHEAMPGHHLQISLSNELEGLPDFRNRTYLSAFGEGWGLYSEWLGKEMGIYETPYEDFGRLTYEMWRACRLVVDPGMHAKGWTRDEAVEFMASNTALSMHEVNTEIDRYIGWPGQAVSYKIGEIKIRELRKRAEAELGELFDVKEFHFHVLKNGSIPLNILEKEINNYISLTKMEASKSKSIKP